MHNESHSTDTHQYHVHSRLRWRSYFKQLPKVVLPFLFLV